MLTINYRITTLQFTDPKKQRNKKGLRRTLESHLEEKENSHIRPMGVRKGSEWVRIWVREWEVSESDMVKDKKECQILRVLIGDHL